MTTNAVIRVHDHGGPECLTLDILPLEPPPPGHLLIEVEAAGVNFFDTQLRSGLYKQPLPLALGNEGAGIVREVGPDVAEFRAGDRVVWVRSAGSYARWKTIPAAQVFALPARRYVRSRRRRVVPGHDGALPRVFDLRTFAG